MNSSTESKRTTQHFDFVRRESWSVFWLDLPTLALDHRVDSAFHLRHGDHRTFQAIPKQFTKCVRFSGFNFGLLAH